MKGMADMIKKAAQLKAHLERTQQELAERRLESSAGGGMVTAVVSGAQDLISISIDPQVLEADDKEMLEDLVKAAVNEGLRQSKELMKEEYGKLTGGLPIPNLF